MTVIYVDVLFTVNFFITFLILQITGKLCKRKERLFRKVLAAFIGGAYSLVILADELAFFVSLAGKLAAAFVIVFTAFGFHGFRCFLKETAIFFFVNFIFVGIVVGLWFIFRPQGIVINNSTVYFDISARVLLLSAFISYIISIVILRIYNNKTAKTELYRLVVNVSGRSEKLFAFADSGNNLKEPFSNFPVIIADRRVFSGVPCPRIIPFSTISDEGALYAFKPESVIIHSGNNEYEIKNVYIALSDNVKKGEYQAIINPKILNEVLYVKHN